MRACVAQVTATAAWGRRRRGRGLRRALPAVGRGWCFAAYACLVLDCAGYV